MGETASNGEHLGRNLLVTGVVSLCGFVWFVQNFASKIYDVLVVKMTSKWYKSVLERLEDGDNVLDIGIGTATALLENSDMIVKKKLQFVGVDYDEQYVSTAQSKVKDVGLEGSVSVFCKSIFDKDLSTILKKKKSEDLFDSAYFSGSWTLMPKPVEALRIAASFVKPDGKIYVTQTFQRKSTPLLGFVKPLLKYVTRIDFGNLHYETDLAEYIKQAQQVVDGLSLVIEENDVVPGSIDNRFQSARLLVFKQVRK